MDPTHDKTSYEFGRLTSRTSARTDPRFRRTRSASTESSEPALLCPLNAAEYVSQNPSSQGDIKPIITLKPKVKETKVTSSSSETQMIQKLDENIIKKYIATLMGHEKKESDNDSDFYSCILEGRASKKNIISPITNQKRSKKCSRAKMVQNEEYRGLTKMVAYEPTYGQSTTKHVLAETSTHKKKLLHYGWKYVGLAVILLTLITLCIFIYVISQQRVQKEEIGYLRSIATHIFGRTIQFIISVFNTILGILLPNDDTQEDTWNLFR